jgi:hypothetical protein
MLKIILVFLIKKVARIILLIFFKFHKGILFDYIDKVKLNSGKTLFKFGTIDNEEISIPFFTTRVIPLKI